MATDRPDDIGSRFPSDAADSAPLNPTRNRQQVNYVIRRPRPNIEIATPAEVQALFTGGFRRALVIAEHDDYLICQDPQTEYYFPVAKPFEHRRTVWDEETIAGWTYIYESDWIRYRYQGDGEGPTDYYYEIIDPYVPGFTEICIMKLENGTGVDAAPDFIDMNIAGRAWRDMPISKFLVNEVRDNDLVCTLFATKHMTERELILAKPFLLRRDTYDGNTYDGVSYTYVSAQERTALIGAEDEETQIIIPPYIEGHSVIYGMMPAGGIGADASVDGLDLNIDGRTWAQEFV